MKKLITIAAVALLASCGFDSAKKSDDTNGSIRVEANAAFHLTMVGDELQNEENADSVAEGDLQVASIADISAGTYVSDLVPSDATLAPIQRMIEVKRGDTTLVVTFLPVSTSTDLTPVEQAIADLKAALEACNEPGNELACKADVDEALAKLDELGVDIDSLDADIQALMDQFQELLDAQQALLDAQEQARLEAEQAQREARWPGSVTVTCREYAPGTANNGKLISGCVVVEPYFNFAAEGDPAPRTCTTDVTGSCTISYLPVGPALVLKAVGSSYTTQELSVTLSDSARHLSLNFNMVPAVVAGSVWCANVLVGVGSTEAVYCYEMVNGQYAPLVGGACVTTGGSASVAMNCATSTGLVAGCTQVTASKAGKTYQFWALADDGTDATPDHCPAP